MHDNISARMQFINRMRQLTRQCPNATLTEEDVAFYEAALVQYGYQRITAALEHILLNRKANDRFPSIADVRAVINPKTDDRALAVEVVGRIFDAMANPGSGLYETGEGWDRHWAKVTAKIGEVGVEVVKRMGGWAELCRVAGEDNQTVLRAQLRDIADAVIKRAAAGKLSEAPTLPAPSSAAVAQIPSRVGALLPDVTKPMPGAGQAETTEGKHHGKK